VPNFRDDDRPVTIDDVTVTEGDGGVSVGGTTYTPMVFTVSGAPGLTFGLDWANQSTSLLDTASLYLAGSRLQYGEGGLDKIQADEGGEEQPAGVDKMGEGHAEQNHDAGENADEGFSFHKGGLGGLFDYYMSI
jgi:hypothetical protein